MRLFPPLEAVWSNVLYGPDSTAGWSRDRRACSNAHFDAYFRFSLGDDTLTKSEIDELIARGAEADFVDATLRKALRVTRSNGSTKAALLLDELNLHADKIADDHVEPLLSAIFKLGDELAVEADTAKGFFAIGDNKLRIHWLLRRLTLDRFDLCKRSSVLVAACEGAALAWLVDFSESAYRGYHPRAGKEPEPERNCLTTSDNAETLRIRALARIRHASKTDELAAHRQLPYLLYQWRDLANDDGTEVKQWIGSQVEHDEMVVKLAAAFTSLSWSHVAGDVVARRNTRASVETLEAIMDKDRFRARVEELARGGMLDAQASEIIHTFLDAWIRYDKNPRH